jgi:hypothetical protein
LQTRNVFDRINNAVGIQPGKYDEGGKGRWQNVQFAAKEYISEIMSAIHIEDQTGSGSQILKE